MKILLVQVHPRRGSLTAAVAEVFANTLSGRGHAVERADLVAESFDPVLREDDEPDWGNPNKTYSLAVQSEMARIERNDATIIVFPVYWWSMPAMLKGWIDRVWNNGWAYGPRKFPQRRVWMVGLAASDHELYRKRGYDTALATQLDTGILDYCGIKERRLELLHGSLKDAEATQAILVKARELAEEF